jgi:hypothetical protein
VGLTVGAAWAAAAGVGTAGRFAGFVGAATGLAGAGLAGEGAVGAAAGGGVGAG